MLALEPLLGLAQPGDCGHCLASPDPSLCRGEVSRQEARRDARGLGPQRLRGVGRCDGALGLARRAG